jgi:hypothetical protein
MTGGIAGGGVTSGGWDSDRGASGVLASLDVGIITVAGSETTARMPAPELELGGSELHAQLKLTHAEHHRTPRASWHSTRCFITTSFR